MQPRLATNSENSSCFILLSAGILGLSYYSWLQVNILKSLLCGRQVESKVVSASVQSEGGEEKRSFRVEDTLALVVRDR